MPFPGRGASPPRRPSPQISLPFLPQTKVKFKNTTENISTLHSLFSCFYARK
jgi:hypothetical protein